ncbi:hypothetical protein TNCV_1958381 [Trichonephila clavipes]|nr:hypothetical protein TNCV_1958381 [Trichonephila clavipes]
MLCRKAWDRILEKAWIFVNVECLRGQSLSVTELNRTVTCVWSSRLRPTTGVHLAPCYNEFRWPESDDLGIRRHKKRYGVV